MDEHKEVDKFMAIERAMARFLVVSGTGQGMRFSDPEVIVTQLSDRELSTFS